MSTPPVLVGVVPCGVLFRLWEAPTGPVTPIVRVGDHWLVADHALVREVLTDQVRFPPDNALDAVTPIPVAALRILARHGFRLPPTLANNGTSSHPGLRRIVAEALHPTRVEQAREWLTGVVRRRVVRLASALRRGEAVDLNAEISYDVPLRVLGRLIALPEEHLGTVKRFAAGALELFWAPVSEARQRELAELVGDVHARLRDFARTGDGLVARLRDHVADHDDLGEDQIVGVLFFLLVAGQETTSQFLTLLLHRLTTEPAALTDVAAGTVAAADVVEEGLRLTPPIVSWRRTAACDTRLGGALIRRGESLLLWLGAAGRDPTVVDHPTRFAPRQRGSRRHLAFGAGAHRCLGAQLSRMEAAVVVSELAPLLRRCRVVRTPHCPDNLSFRMPDSFVVVHR